MSAACHSTFPALRRAPSAVLVLLVLLVLTGCADDSADEAGSATPTATTAVEATAAPPSSPATTPFPSPTATTAVGDVPPDDVPPDDIPGEPFTDGPEPGAVLGVVGVAADDVLNVRDVPGTDGEIFGTLDPLTEDVAVTGRARSVDGGIWYQIEGGAADDGWVNARYLAHLGDTTDVTSELPERPRAETLLDLADAVAELRLPSDAEANSSRVVISDGPTVGDLGEVTVDIVGLPDDAVVGERLHVFAVPTDDGEGFALRTVERTLLCARGVSGGLCL